MKYKTARFLKGCSLSNWGRTAVLLALLLLGTACASAQIEAPIETADGWQAGTLEEAGLDEQPIAEALQRIENDTYAGVHGLLIVKDDRLVLETYFPGHVWQYDAEHFQGPYAEFDRDSLHTIMSVTKAVTAAAVGIAVEQGAIGSVHDPVFDYFPAYQGLRTPDNEALTIEHLLTMSSGLEWNEWEYLLSDTRNDLIQLWLVEDPVAYILDKPLAHDPGSYWYYSGGDVILLGEIIQEATGQRLDQYAAEQLLAPLGITEYEWDFIDEDTVHASGDLMLRPRDMAKIGYLLLNNGRWQGEQILSEEWVEKTMGSYIDTRSPGQGDRYGYQWWHMTFPSESGPVEALHRSGWGGQELYLFPDLNMLVAMTGGNYEGAVPSNEIITKHIIPACATRQPPPPQTHSELPYTTDLQAALDQALHDGRGSYDGRGSHDIGISAAVLVPGYQPWTGVSGNSHPGVPITPDMLFNMGSIAKTYEAALALQLAEEGQLDLDQPISAWLPTYPNVDARITPRQLLNHTSGLYNLFEHPNFPWVSPHVDYKKEWPLDQTLQRFVAEPYGPPGFAQHYSSTNYLLLTHILRQTTDSAVPREITQRFLQPLALDQTYVSMGDLPPPRYTIAHPWVDIDGDGMLEDLSGTPQTWIASMTHPVLYATPHDIARWTADLHRDQHVLSAESMAQMLTFPPTTVPDPEGGRYGLGVIDFSDVLGIPVIGHGGSTLGTAAAALYLPDQEIVLAWAINTGESPAPLASDLMQKTWANLSQVILDHQP